MLRFRALSTSSHPMPAAWPFAGTQTGTAATLGRGRGRRRRRRWQEPW